MAGVELGMDCGKRVCLLDLDLQLRIGSGRSICALGLQLRVGFAVRSISSS